MYQIRLVATDEPFETVDGRKADSLQKQFKECPFPRVPIAGSDRLDISGSYFTDFFNRFHLNGDVTTEVLYDEVWQTERLLDDGWMVEWVIAD